MLYVRRSLKKTFVLILAGLCLATFNSRTTPAFAANLLINTDALESWAVQQLNPFAANDSGAAGVGSFANTIRTTDPQGGYAADFLQEDSSQGFHFAAQKADLSAGTYTMSAWLKAAGRPCAELNISGTTSAVGVRFNLATGAVQTSYEHGPWAVRSSSITAAANGWHYCTATFRLSGSEPASLLVVPALEETNSYLGDAASGTYVWNVSLTAETDFPGRGAPGLNPPLLRSSPDSRYFLDPDGKAVFLAGSHSWNTLQDWSAKPALDFEAYLDKLQEAGHNCTRIWQLDLLNWDWIPWGVFGTISPLPWNRTGPGTASDGQPKVDLCSLNNAFFNRLSNRVAAASARGIYVKLMLFEGCWFQFTGGKYFEHSPYNAANNVNRTARSQADVYTLNDLALVALQKKYVAKVIDSVNAFDNVIYEIINEAPPGSRAWQVHMVEFIKHYQATKPKQHPVGMSAFYSGPGEEEIMNGWLKDSPSEWISIFGGHSVRPIYGENPPVLNPPAPVPDPGALPTWDLTKLNPFSALDSGVPSAGSIAGTGRTTDPQGGYTAHFLQEDNTDGFHFAQRRLSLVPGAYTISGWFKSAGRPCVELNVSGDTSAAGVRFNLNTGAIQSSYQHGPWTVVNSTMTPGSNGWHQGTATFRLAGGESTSLLVLPTLEQANHYRGDNTSGIFAWDVQLASAESSQVTFLDTDHVWGIGGDRNWVWKAFTRGYNLLYMDPHDTVPADLGWGWVIDDSAPQAMGDAVSYAKRMNLGAMSSSSTVASTGYALCNPGVEYLVWQPNGANEFTVDLAPGTYNCEWFDPRARIFHSWTITATSGPTLFTPPANTTSSVLYLKAN